MSFNCAEVKELIRTDGRITIRSVATALGWSYGLTYSIMYDYLKFRKVCARWVPRELKDREKMNRTGVSLQRLLWHADEGEDKLNRIVTGDKSCVRHYQPETKRASMQWKHPSLSSRSTKILRLLHQLGRLCFVLWSSTEDSGCNSQKNSTPTGKRFTAWQCQNPYSHSNSGEHSWTTVGTFEYPSYIPDLALMTSVCLIR
jgi:hypothetical protein